MATISLLSSCSTFLFLIFAFSTAAVPCANARLHAALFSTSSLVHPRTIDPRAKVAHNVQALHKMYRSSNSLVISKVLMVGEQDAADGVVRSTPARQMPANKQSSAPTPLPEFPTLGPPIVWSFPATPLPAVEAAPAPPPQDIPTLPKTGSKNISGPPPSCEGRAVYHRSHPRMPPSVPYVAAEPAGMPGPLEAPEGAPEPTAGGPLLPPYH
ncbi:hypothetical protein GOP47_0003548 [Adiantum capillus-veneris]|uniref:Uncharacterized protein n=1 Tax=Adiantum capillus-veneris TaxID=13818 RepID=A0A9D4VC59_ADICA|nr:hypothetical protein GOP47_0003548 [Adiantum capillus-veneris]